MSVSSTGPRATASPRSTCAQFVLVALEPRETAWHASPEDTLRVLDGHVALIGAWCELAIARGWDTRRIAFPAEGERPFSNEVAAILGRGEGHAGDAIAAAEASITERTARLEAVAGCALSPLAALAKEFCLSPLAQAVLMIVAAPTLWGELGRVYAIIANDPDRPLCDELLVCQILGSQGVHRVAIARELDAEAPLLRHGIVRVKGGARPFDDLSVDPIITRRLRGDIHIGQGAASGIVTLRAPDRGVDEIELPAELVQQVITALTRAPSSGPIRLVLRGRTGSGRRTFLAALAAAANRTLGVIDAALLGGPRLAEGMADELRRTSLLGWLPCVTGLDNIDALEPGPREQLREVFAAHPGPIAFHCGHEARPPLRGGYLSFDLPNMSESQRMAFWQRTLAAYDLPVMAAATMAARYTVGPGIITRVINQVAAERAGKPSHDNVTADLVAALQQHRDERIAIAKRVTRMASWSNMVLPPDVISSLREFISRVRHRRTVYDTWGFDRIVSSSRGLVALFKGGPGTGKSMVAGVIARELGYDLYRIDLARIMSKWIGETERNLATVFDAAEDGQAIILFDEADSLFGKRSEVRTSIDRYANAEVNYLLQRLDTFEGIAILTTNFGAMIDPAFKRRLSLSLTFPFPDAALREQIWRVHLPPELPIGGAIDLEALAKKYQLSGGYIRNATLRAAFLAAQEGAKLTQAHLEGAILSEYREMGKLDERGQLE